MRSLAIFFVGLIQPFVWYSNPSNSPSVGYKLPLTPPRSKMMGFTLMELLVTVSLVGILAAIAIPSFTGTFQNTRLSTQTNDLIVDLNFARAEAIKRHLGVDICHSTDGITCTATPGTNGWELGRLLYVDADGSNSLTNGDTILRFREPLTGGNTLRSDIPLGPAGLNDPLIFDYRGMPNTANGVVGIDPGTASFILCDSRGTANMFMRRIITINPVGQIKLWRLPAAVNPALVPTC